MKPIKRRVDHVFFYGPSLHPLLIHGYFWRATFVGGWKGHNITYNAAFPPRLKRYTAVTTHPLNG